MCDSHIPYCGFTCQPKWRAQREQFFTPSVILHWKQLMTCYVLKAVSLVFQGSLQAFKVLFPPQKWKSRDYMPGRGTGPSSAYPNVAARFVCYCRPFCICPRSVGCWIVPLLLLGIRLLFLSYVHGKISYLFFRFRLKI